jgi:hypothetical protein
VKKYLGDGLYAEFDGYQVELYASNGVTKTDSVYFDFDVLKSFERFVEQVRAAK